MLNNTDPDQALGVAIVYIVFVPILLAAAIAVTLELLSFFKR